MQKKKKNELKQRISEIINNKDLDNLEQELKDYCTKAGIEEKEISRFIRDIFQMNKKVVKNFKFRIISPVEIKNLDDEALDYLINLKNFNEINDSVFEEVLVDVLKSRTIVNLDKIKSIIKLNINKKIIIN